ncbi:S8 family serine peptidase [Streptomyces sp. H10-C2]|uniref:S8 family serine peptidase n=1 Tax=unclassified Streptomyces TaxID=2593676 RepID=UPI0024B8FC9C|nr:MULTISPECIES: S8 family serine peptidase [unclassified Streptomyces]MDJ0342329.1 S8 family serine peptidase [Streptomyces sp. PH10-H1]MDJ0372184.1 S8 family serine peptidase [Streptomyces sp. H10-C2]
MRSTVKRQRRRAQAVMSVLGSLLVIGGAIAPAASADTMRDRQWYLDRMQSEEMWEVSTGKGITVAVLDSGVLSTAPELTGKVLAGKNFVEPQKDARADPSGHGTAMAMLIAGNGVNNQGIKGLSPDANILPLTVLGSTQESGTNSAKALIEALRYAADSDARIINMSLGLEGFRLKAGEQDQIQQAVDYAVHRGKLLLASTGNNGDTGNDVSYPSASLGVAGIGAVDKSSSVAKFSVFGPQVALAAPGDDIPSRCIDGKSGYCRSWGTSQATAIASASAALIWAMHPTWTGNQVLRVLMNTAGKPTEGAVPSRYIGYGTVRPRMAVLGNPGDPGPADVNPLVATRSPNSPSPSSSASSGSGPSKPPTQQASPGTTAKAGDGKGISAIVWIAVGVGAVVVIGAVLLLRRRSAGLGR